MRILSSVLQLIDHAFTMNNLGTLGGALADSTVPK